VVALLLALAALSLALPQAPAAAAPAPEPPTDVETTPLPPEITGGADESGATRSGSTGAIARMVVGLAIVLAVVYGVYWLLRKTSGGRRGAVRADGGMDVVASLPLGQTRGLHLVQVGDELVLVGVGEQGVTRVHAWGPDEARRLQGVLETPAHLAPRGGKGLVDELRRRTLRS
jgi:flagellar protein FliO/FliZ